MKHLGHWWNPAHPDVQLRGTLHLPERSWPWLAFEAPMWSQLGFKLNGAATIHGILDDGREVTLWASGWAPVQPVKGNKPGIQKFKRVFSQAFIGAHLRDVGDTVFASSSYQYQSLDLWSQHPTFALPGEPDPEHPTAELQPYDGAYTVTIRIENAAVVRRQPLGNRIDQGGGDHAQITFVTEPAAPLEFHQHLAHDCQALLTFSYQERAYTTREFVSLKDGRVLQMFRRRQLRPLRRKRSGNEMIITANTATIGPVFEAWWRAVTDLYPLTQVLAGVHYTRSGFLEHQVIAAIAALEKFYENLPLPQHRVDPAIFRTQLKWHRENESNPEIRKMLAELGNRPTLRMKLRGVSQQVDPAILAAANIDPDQWITNVMSVRNGLAHSGSHVTGVNADDGTLLKDVDTDTRAVLTLMLCSYLGLSDPQLLRAATILGSNSNPIHMAAMIESEMKEAGAGWPGRPSISNELPAPDHNSDGSLEV